MYIRNIEIIYRFIRTGTWGGEILDKGDLCDTNDTGLPAPVRVVVVTVDDDVNGERDWNRVAFVMVGEVTDDDDDDEDTVIIFDR